MSELAAQYIADAIGSPESSRLLVAACEPRPLHSRLGETFDIHTARGRGSMSLSDSIEAYAIPLVRVVGAAMVATNNDNYLSAIRWTDRPNKVDGDLVAKLFGNKVKTGKISGLTVEALAPSELPDVVVSHALDFDRAGERRTHYPESTLYLRLLAAAKIGSVPTALACVMTLTPYRESYQKAGHQILHYAYSHRVQGYPNGELSGQHIVDALSRAVRDREIINRKNALHGGGLSSSR